jgi:O-antigen biosynthesis protein WbqV
MTIPEAAQLVITAAQYGLSHSESRGRIHVLDMGESVRILDLAKNMIRLAGYLPDLEIPIRFVGLRPGEKIYEELFDASEQRISTTATGILEAVSNPMPNDVVLAKFRKIEAACQRGDEESGLRLLAATAAMRRDSSEPPADWRRCAQSAVFTNVLPLAVCSKFTTDSHIDVANETAE